MDTTISKKSLFADLYKFVWRDSLPSGLCPFFWLNLIGIILLVPYILFSLPRIIINLFQFRNSGQSFIDFFSINEEKNIFIYSIFSIGSWLIIFVFFGYISGGYNLFIPGYHPTEPIFVIFTLIGLVSGSVILYDGYIKDWRYDRDLKKALEWNRSLDEDIREDEFYSNIIYHKYMDLNKKTSKWDIIKQALKAWYDKNCPVINWTND